MTKQLPIGYWVKHLDEVLTRRIDQVLHDSSFTRSHWQVINIIYEVGTIARQDVLATMKTFIDSSRLNDILGEFAKEGWLVEHGSGDTGQLTLTDAGKTKRDTVFRLQGEVRRRLMQGVTEEEYTTVISVLQRMAENIE